MKRTSLSLRERMARAKIIQELQYTKDEQYLLDQYVSAFNKTYREIHDNIEEGNVLLFMAEIGWKRLAEASVRDSYTNKGASSAIRRVIIQLRENRRMEESLQ